MACGIVDSARCQRYAPGGGWDEPTNEALVDVGGKGYLIRRKTFAIRTGTELLDGGCRRRKRIEVGQDGK